VPGADPRTRRNWNSNATAYSDRTLGDGLSLDTARLLAIDIAADGGLEFVGGELAIKAATVRTVTGTATALITDRIIICNSASAFTVTLPAAADRTGHILDIKNINAGIVTVDGDSAETVDDMANQTISKYDSITVVSDGSEWWII
jgi:hypothetical protein